MFPIKTRKSPIMMLGVHVSFSRKLENIMASIGASTKTYALLSNPIRLANIK